MSKFLWNAKGYIAHLILVVIVFLDPSVRSWLAMNPMYAMVGAAAWGGILHWATGKLSAPKSGSLAILAAVLLVPVFFVGCSAQQDAQYFSNVIQGILQIGQAEIQQFPVGDQPIVQGFVSGGLSLQGQLNTCIAASGSTKTKLAICFGTFAAGFASPAELNSLRVTNANTQHNVIVFATGTVIAINQLLTKWGQPTIALPAITPAAPATSAELHMLSARLEAAGYQIE